MIEKGCVDIWLDEIVPCLKDLKTGLIEETFVFKIESRSILKKYNSHNGWEIDWINIPSNVEIFALALKRNNEVQGLVALKNDFEAKAVYLHWACTAPRNNIHAYGKQKYSGVGGHLFAIAVDISFKLGYDGFVYGFALNRDLLNHYITKLGCFFVGILHPYHFLLEPDSARRLLENYTYEWN
ncbi:MAG: hypothetical protein IJM92_05250 [Fibrobacter sp.]|uniref:hypothetical protein n=1 Tax=Fibrobacter sp. TaxID=35828 RepID=UPI0025C227C7|nr:hypothetical protein [Fibrobacter sp.]MBQ7079069.1 hypothetical protein [Fibrobacter sp.]